MGFDPRPRRSWGEIAGRALRTFLISWAVLLALVFLFLFLFDR